MILFTSRYKFPRRAVWRPPVRQGVQLWGAGSGAEEGDGQAGEGGGGEEEGGGAQAAGAGPGHQQEEQVGPGGGESHAWYTQTSYSSI